MNLFSVVWYPINHPMVYGNNVTLFCNTSAVTEDKTTWMKERDVIVHHGVVFNTSKFLEMSDKTGSYLTIIRSTFSDFNISYTCICDVFSYESILYVNNTNFVGNCYLLLIGILSFGHVLLTKISFKYMSSIINIKERLLCTNVFHFFYIMIF